MAKHKKAVQEIAAEMSPEQKKEYLKVMKRDTIISIVLIVILVVLLFNQMSKGKAMRDVSFLDGVRYTEAVEAYDTAFLLCMGGCVVEMIASLVMLIIRKRKYPYYSERLFFYLWKEERQQKKAEK